MVGTYNRSSRVACRVLRMFFQKELSICLKTWWLVKFSSSSMTCNCPRGLVLSAHTVSKDIQNLSDEIPARFEEWGIFLRSVNSSQSTSS
jgi:hypothetical protein